MKRLLCLLTLALPLFAFAAPPPPPGAPGEGGPDTPAQRERLERRVRLARVVGLADVLGLSEGDALRMAETLRRFDDRRRQLRDQVIESSKVLERAAEGDAAAGAQVDQATAKVFDARSQIAQLDREMFTTLAKDLRPQQRAKMALFLARFEKEIRAEAFLKKSQGMPHLPGRDRVVPGPDRRRDPTGY